MGAPDQATEPDGWSPKTPGDGFRLRHRIVSVQVPPSLPDRVDGYDRPEFDPALRALLEVLRRDSEASADEDIAGLIRSEMPDDLKALLLTTAFAGGVSMSLPMSAARDMQLDSFAFEIPGTDNESYYLFDDDGGRYFAPDGLEADYLFRLGNTPDGEIMLFAAWNAGDARVTFGTCTFGGYEDDGASPIGDIGALLSQVAEWIDEVDEDICDTELTRAWLELTREQG